MRLLAIFVMGLGAACSTTADAPCAADSDASSLPCATNDDCSSGEQCLFPIGCCSATGQCKPKQPALCNSFIEMCACDGGAAFTGCGFPDGFASAPSTGRACP